MPFVEFLGNPNFHQRTNPRFKSRGQGYIAGEGASIVTKAGAPAREKVTLCLKDSELPLTRIAEQLSKADGTYRFDQLDESKKYIVLAFDSSGQFNAVIRDNITPAVDP